jgi:3-dehydroquinate dehydratase-2
VPTILLLSGPNLNLFGQRDPAAYGTATLDDMVDDARKAAAEHGYELEHRQSNHEGAIVDAIQDARNRCDAIVINPGALGHYSYAIADALQTFDGVKVELHVSNTAAREEWRHHSVISASVTGTIVGLGRVGYRLAIEAAVAKLGERET